MAAMMPSPSPRLLPRTSRRASNLGHGGSAAAATPITAVRSADQLRQGRCAPHSALVAPARALRPPLLDDLLHRDLCGVLPLGAERADGHEQPQQNLFGIDERRSVLRLFISAKPRSHA